ncbi:MAG TPA: cupin-like domain-containing protein [Thermoanaerobaculia bacterium]|jgi:lysine-specific demethylase 8
MTTNAALPLRRPIPLMQPFDAAGFDRDFRNPGRPVIVKGAASSWPAVKTWSPDYFAEKFGDMQIEPSIGLPDTEVPYQFTDADYRRAMTVAQFVELMKSGDRCYVDQLSVSRYEGVADEYHFDTLGPHELKDVVFWMGANTRSGLHYDYVDNFFAQVHGTKVVILAAPDQARNLHLFSDCHTKSQVAPQTPDLRKHPRFARAEILQATLEPGDVLYLPKGWWHYFASSTSSISLSCWHGVPLTPSHDVKIMLSIHSPAAWLRLVRDFLWHGLLNRPYKRRLYSPPPTGRMLYELVASMLTGKRG